MKFNMSEKLITKIAKGVNDTTTTLDTISFLAGNNERVYSAIEDYKLGKSKDSHEEESQRVPDDILEQIINDMNRPTIESDFERE